MVRDGVMRGFIVFPAAALALALAALPCLGGEEAGAATPEAQAPDKSPSVLVKHFPIAEAKSSKAVEISVDVTNDWEMESLVLLYRKQGEKTYRKVKFAISSSRSYVATVKGEDVSYPGFEYAVWVKEKGKEGRFAFASVKQPHPVVVSKLSWKERRKLRLMANRGLTSTFFADYAYTWFGLQQQVDESTGEVQVSALDQFHRAEFGYSYRILTVLYAFRFGVGIVRGTTLKEGIKQPVGLDYGFASLLFEFHRLLAVEPKVIFGGSEEGLEAGGGAVLRIGNTLGTHVDLGFEIITTVGSTVLLRFAWDTVPGFMMGLNAELTDFPSSQSWGTRLYFDAAFIGYKHVYARGLLGYATRNSRKGGVIAGVSVDVNF